MDKGPPSSRSANLLLLKLAGQKPQPWLSKTAAAAMQSLQATGTLCWNMPLHVRTRTHKGNNLQSYLYKREQSRAEQSRQQGHRAQHIQDRGDRESNHSRIPFSSHTRGQVVRLQLPPSFSVPLPFRSARGEPEHRPGSLFPKIHRTTATASTLSSDHHRRRSGRGALLCSGSLFMMRRLLLDLNDDGYHQHRSLNTEPATNSSASSSSSHSSGGGCNSKQTINAGDNPCPAVQSPLPYMLAGLAAMVLLVVISLLILACSYLRGYFAMEQQQQQQRQQQQQNQQQPSSSSAGSKAATLHSAQAGGGVSDDKILVILPGEAKPTHLAQPVRVLLAAAAAAMGGQVHSRSASPARPGMVVVPEPGPGPGV